MEVAPFFVDFHHFLSIFTIYALLSRFTHFFRKFLLAKIAFSATSHVFCMYAKMLPTSHNSFKCWPKKQPCMPQSDKLGLIFALGWVTRAALTIWRLPTLWDILSHDVPVECEEKQKWQILPRVERLIGSAARKESSSANFEILQVKVFTKARHSIIVYI